MHSMRNVLSKVPKASGDMVAAAMRTIFAQPDAAHVRSQLTEIVTTLQPQFPDVAIMLTDATEDLLAFTGFPLAHWRNACSIASGAGPRRGCWGPGDDSIGICLRGFSISVSPR